MSHSIPVAISWSLCAVCLIVGSDLELQRIQICFVKGLDIGGPNLHNVSRRSPVHTGPNNGGVCCCLMGYGLVEHGIQHRFAGILLAHSPSHRPNPIR